MRQVLVDAIIGFNWFVVVYFVLLNTSQLGLVSLAVLDVVRTFRWSASSGYDEVFASPLTPGISILVPAYNESAGIAHAVRAMLTVRYPLHEVVVVDDGSTDDTFEVLRKTFGLIESHAVVADRVPVMGAVQSLWVSGSGEPLTVVRKKNAGRRADALNVGLNVARHELVCMVDADSVLNPDALLRVAKPFVDDPQRVIATGGIVRAANGAQVQKGRVLKAHAPATWIERVQLVEYMRAFLLSRAGWSRIGGLLIISGAFGLFRRQMIYELGGLDASTLAEDADLVASLHLKMRREHRDYRIVFIPDPVCWTEVPNNAAVLGRQRQRWSHGLVQLLWKFRVMMGNPRYGVTGMLTMPYYLLFEALGPVIEALGVVTVVLAISLGMMNWSFVLILLLASIGYGAVISILAVAVDELAFHEYERLRDLLLLVAATLYENIGYRQRHAWWRLKGLVAALRGRPAGWGVMTRAGFSDVSS